MEGNKLIAEFMGYHTYESNGYDMVRYSDCNERTLQDTHYHSSWDWLMPVFEKCLVGEAEQSEEISNTLIKNIYDGICSQDISFAYKSVVEFIKEQKKLKL